LFYIPKAAVLHGKSVGFASQKSRFRNAKSKLPFFKEIIFTKQQLFSAKTTAFPQGCNSSRSPYPTYRLLSIFRYV